MGWRTHFKTRTRSTRCCLRSLSLPTLPLPSSPISSKMVGEKKSEEPFPSVPVSAQQMLLSRFNKVNEKDAVHVSFLSEKADSKNYKGPEQLFVDFTPVPSADFSFDPVEKVLQWKGAAGGGKLSLRDTKATAQIGTDTVPENVTLSSGMTCLCDVAKDVGASHSQGSDEINYYPECEEWNAANWQPNRLLFTWWTSHSGEIARFNISYTDQKEDPFTGKHTEDLELVQDPEYKICDVRASFSEKEGKPTLQLVKMSSDRWLYTSSVPEQYPKTCIPPKVTYNFDMALTEVTGGFSEVDFSRAPAHGLKGSRQYPRTIGFYLVEGKSCPFSVFNGGILIDGKVPKGLASFVSKDKISWRSMPADLQSVLGLPEDGEMTLDGEHSLNGVGVSKLKARKMSAEMAIEAISTNAQIWSDTVRSGVSPKKEKE